jgi:hypothetical protein
MNKKLLLTLSGLILLILTVTPAFAVDPVDFSPLGPCGVVLMVTNGEVTWYGEEVEDGGILGNLIQKKTILNTAQLLAQGEKTLFDTLAGHPLLPLADNKDLLASGTYKVARETLMSKSGMLTSIGYRFIDFYDSALLSTLAKENGLGSVMAVHFIFEKAMLAGVGKTGKMGGYVTLRVFIADADGKMVLQRSYFASTETEEGIKVSFEKFDEKSLWAMYPGLITRVCQEFLADIK